MTESPVARVDLDDLRLATRVIGGKWKTAILYQLATRSMRFAGLRRAVGTVSEKVLTQQLRELEADGVVRRWEEPSVPPKVHYAITDHGLTLCAVIERMAAWGGAHRAWGRAQAPELPAADEPPR